MLSVITGDVRRNIALGYKIGLNMPDMVMDKLEEAERDPYYDVRGIFGLYVPSPLVFDYVIHFDGTEFSHPVVFLPDRSLLAGGMGADLPANLTTAIPGRIHLVNQLRRLASEIQKYNRHFRGWVTLRLVLHEDKIYYNHISFELLEDYYHCLMRLYGYTNPDYFILDYRDGRLPEPKGIVTCARLYAYPYSAAENIATILPYSEILEAIEGEDSFIVLHHQEKVHIKHAWQALYKRINRPAFKHNGMVYNPDGGEKARMIYNALQKARALKNYK